MLSFTIGRISTCIIYNIDPGYTHLLKDCQFFTMKSHVNVKLDITVLIFMFDKEKINKFFSLKPNIAIMMII